MNQYQMQAPRLSPLNKILLIILASVFVLSAAVKQMAGMNLQFILGLSANGVLKGKVWGLFTYPFIETGMMSVLFNGLILWFVGSDLELRWGRKTYLKFLLFSIIGPAVVYLLLGFIMGQESRAFYTPLMGINGISYALLVSYAVIFPERQFTFMFLFPMQAKYFCLLLGGIELYMGIFSSNSIGAFAHLAAMGTGFGFLRFKSLQSKFAQNRKKNIAKKSNLYIVRDDNDENGPKYWQ